MVDLSIIKKLYSGNPKEPVGIVRENNKMTLFKVIPDRSISNQQNKKFWRLIHEVMELDYSLKNRVEREGLIFKYKMKDQIWFDIVARSKPVKIEKNGEIIIEHQKQIEFFLCIPTKFAKTVRQKLLDKHPQLTIDEVDLSNVEVPQTSSITEFRYNRHDIFSLRSNDNEQTSPLSSIMNTVYDLHEDDFMRFSVAAERISRKKWKGLADYGWNQLDKKRVPSRVRFDPGKTAQGLTDIIKFVTYEVKDILDSTLEAIQRSFFKSNDDTFIRDRQKNFTQAEYDRLMINGTLSSETKKKIFEPVFKTKIRLAVQSNDPSRELIIRNSISNALSELNGDNQLKPFKLKVNIRAKTIEEMNSYQNIIKDRDVNIMSTKEMGKLHQYPTAELQRQFSDILESKKRLEVEVPHVFQDENGIPLGHAEVRGEKVNVYLPTPKNDRDGDEFMMSRVFIGSPRMGKDTAMINFVVEAAKRGYGSVVLDVIDERGNDRGMCDSIRDALPTDKLIDLDFSNIHYPIYVGLNEVINKSENAGNRLANDFATIFEIEDQGRTRTYLREAVKAMNGDLLQVRLLLLCHQDEGDLLDRTIKRLKKEGKEYQALFWEAYRNESKGQKSEIRKPILNRLDEIFGDDHLKNIFGQKPNNDIDFGKWLKEGKVIMLRVPNNHPDLSEISVKTLAQWFVLKTFYTKLVMQDKKCYSFLVLNEPHQFMSDGLIKVLNRMFRECPKYRLAILMAFHDFAPSTLPSSLVDSLLSSSLNWHIFKNTNTRVYQKLERYLQPTYTPDEAMDQTPRYHCINAFFIGGEYQEPFMIKSLAPINKRYEPYNNINLTKSHSEKFGRKKEDVEHEIFEQERFLFLKV